MSRVQTITTGEGGMLVTNDGELARNARHLYDHASDPTNRYWHDRIGYNFRMSKLQAALGLAQLSRIAIIESTKLAIMEAYRQQLRDVKSAFQHIRHGPDRPVFFAAYYSRTAKYGKRSAPD
jgi:perosamine synthetase